MVLAVPLASYDHCFLVYIIDRAVNLYELWKKCTALFRSSMLLLLLWLSLLLWRMLLLILCLLLMLLWLLLLLLLL